MSTNGEYREFNYASAKDVLKWNNLSVKEHIKTVMDIGKFLFLDDKTFSKWSDNITIEDISIEEVRKAYRDFENGNSSN